MADSDDKLEMHMEAIEAMGTRVITEQDKMNLFLYRKVNKLCETQDAQGDAIVKALDWQSFHAVDCKEYREKNDKRLSNVDKVAAEFNGLQTRFQVAKEILLVLFSGIVAALAVQWFG